MQTNTHLRASDVRGTARLVIDAVVQTTTLVEHMHHNIMRKPWPIGRIPHGPAPGITGFVYSCVRGVSRGVGAGIDCALGPIAELLDSSRTSAERETVIAAVNGVLGDHLHSGHNPLAIRMSLRRGGTSLELRREALARSLPQAGGKVLVLIHGLCMNDLQWQRGGHDHGVMLAREFGYTPLYLHYNSGRHISDNGRELAHLLDNLVREWPGEIESLSILGHSMGGLVARSACHQAAPDSAWLPRLDRLVFLGSPHHGAPLERHGNKLQTFVAAISPYVSPLARLGMLRSAGVTDLRHGNLTASDWQDCDRFERTDDCRTIVPLPPQARCYAMAATLGQSRRDACDRWLADGLVPVWSALGEHRDPRRDLGIPETRRWIGHGMSHWDLLDRPETRTQLLVWFR